MKAVPPGLKQVVTMACGTCANENAYKTAFFWYMRKKRGAELPPPEDPAYQSCMINQVKQVFAINLKIAATCKICSKTKRIASVQMTEQTLLTKLLFDVYKFLSRTI